jgi:hypothetical protein
VVGDEGRYGFNAVENIQKCHQEKKVALNLLLKLPKSYFIL